MISGCSVFLTGKKTFAGHVPKTPGIKGIGAEYCKICGICDKIRKRLKVLREYQE